MLNILVDKAIQRSFNQSQLTEPIFTISYCSLSPNRKFKNIKNQKNKTLSQKISQSHKNDENIFQKWKSKTLQKLKDLQPKKSQQQQMSFSNRQIKSRQKSVGYRIQLALKQPQNLANQSMSFKVHKRKVPQKSLSLKANHSDSPSKSIYLLYKDEKKNKINKGIAFNHIYQRKLLQRQLKNKDTLQSSRQIQNQEQNDENMVNQTKNVSFLSTIQYKTVPRDQIRHYKAGQFQNIKRNIFSRAENSFRTNYKCQKQQTTKVVKQFNNHYLSITPPNNNIPKNLPSPKNEQSQQKEVKEVKQLKQHKNVQIKNIRNVYTQKRSRKIFNDAIFEDVEQKRNHKKFSIDTYRPWSPVKTNPPLLMVNQEQLLFQESKTFNIFSNIQKFNKF